MIPEILEDALGFNIYRVSLLFRREFIWALKQYERTPEQWHILLALWSAERPLKQCELVQLTLKDKPTISRSIFRLERDGWVEKVSDAKDARVTVICLTEKSRSLKQEVFQKLEAHRDTLLKDFTKQELSTLMQLLKKLRHVLGDYS